MATLTSRTVADSYYELLKLDSPFTSEASLRQVEDGVGNILPLQISQEKVRITGEFELGNTLTLTYPLVSNYNGSLTALSITSPLVSSSSTTGALTVTGGVGIKDDLYVGNEFYVGQKSYFTGDAKFYGNVNIDGALTLAGNIVVGNADTDNISFVADVNSNLIPDVTETYNIGSTTKRWNQVWSKDATTKNLTVSETVSLSPTGGAASVTISPTTILTVNPSGTTSTLNNVTIGGTTPRAGTFTTLTQSGTTGTVAFAGTTNSTTSATGAVTIAGGVGIAQNLNIGQSLSVASTGSNSVTFNPPFTANSTSTFTNLVTINPPNTTVNPLRIANNNSDAVTVDTTGQLNVLKTSVYTGKATFNGVAEVNNVFQQISAGSTSTFAGPVSLNNTGAASLTVNGASILRNFTARDAAGTTDVLTFSNTTNTLTTANANFTNSLLVGVNTSATSTNYPNAVTVNSTGTLTAANSVTLAAGYISTSTGNIILAGTVSTIEPAVAGDKRLRIRPSVSSATDIITLDFATKVTTIAGTLALSPATGGSISTNVLPTTDNAVDLGSSLLRWRDLNLSRNLNVAGLITATSTGEHVLTGNLRINGNLTTVGSQTTTGGQLSVSSSSKELKINVASDNTNTNKAVQNLSSSAVGGGLFINATLPLKVNNTVAAINSATETITHSFNVPIDTITAVRTDLNTDVTSLFTFSQTTNTSVVITWGASTTTTLGTVGNPGGIQFTLTPQSSYGFYGQNSTTAANGNTQTVTHNLLTTAIAVTISDATSGIIVPSTTYTVTTPTSSTATITWGATAPGSAINALRIKVVPTATVQQSASVTYTTPTTSISTPSIPEPQFYSSDNFGLASGKSYFINNARVLSATSLGDSVVSSKLTSVGTITSGVWAGTNISGAQGGTGANNSGKTITVAGNFATTGTTGSAAVTLATTGNTTVTLPTSGTLSTLANTETLTNKTLGTAALGNITIPSGALSVDLAVADGGTGRSSLIANGVLYGAGTNAVNSSNVGTDKQVLISSAGVPTFATISPVITLTGDVTGSATMTDLGNVTINTTVGPDNVALGTDTTGSYVSTLAVSGSGLSLTNSSPSADGATVTVSSNGTALNTPSTLVFRDSNGNFSASTITATTFSGNATSASQADRWTTPRTLTLTGAVSGNATLDGASNSSIFTSISAGSITNSEISATAQIADSKLATLATAGKVANSATTAISGIGITNPASTSLKNSIVSRDNNGDILANQVYALGYFNGTATGVVDNVSRQRVKVSGYNSLGLATTVEKDEIVFSSNSNCSVWVSEANNKTSVQVYVPAVTSFTNDFNDANLLVSDDITGGRIKFKLDTLSDVSSANAGGSPRELNVADTSQTLVGYTNATPISGTPGNLTTFPFLKWDSVPQALEVKLAGSSSTDVPKTVYIPFYTS